MRWRILTAALLIIISSACAAPLPDHDPNMAWIEVRTQAGHQLSAQRLDRKKVNDARYFQVEPGAHHLQVRLSYDHGGSRMGSSQRRCLVDIVYDDFQAGQLYSIRALAKGWTVRAWLYDAEGQQLIESRPVRCGSQY